MFDSISSIFKAILVCFINDIMSVLENVVFDHAVWSI